DGSGLGFTRQLGVDDFVRPKPLAAGLGNAQKHVGPAEPLAVGEGALGDGFGALCHQAMGLLQRLFIVLNVLEIDDRQVLVTPKEFQISLLMFQAEFPEHNQVRRGPLWSVAFAEDYVEIESSKVAAGEVVAEVSGSETEFVVDEPHRKKEQASWRVAPGLL